MSEIARVRKKIPEIFEPMMVPHLEQIDKMISPGLTILRWTSLNIDAYVDSVTTSVKSLELLIDRAIDIWSIQIEGNLSAIQSTQLCELPENEPWTIEQFVNKTRVRLYDSMYTVQVSLSWLYIFYYIYIQLQVTRVLCNQILL